MCSVGLGTWDVEFPLVPLAFRVSPLVAHHAIPGCKTQRLAEPGSLRRPPKLSLRASSHHEDNNDGHDVDDDNDAEYSDDE